MPRTFCLYCTRPRKPGPCGCDASAETLAGLERREREHREAFDRARNLTPRDLGRMVLYGAYCLPVAKLLGLLVHDGDVAYETPLRATGQGLVQVVYYKKGKGTALLRWPWVCRA